MSNNTENINSTDSENTENSNIMTETDKNNINGIKDISRIVVVGPVYPYKGGIAHYTGLLIKNLRKKYHVDAVSFKMQYPKIMFRKEQKDYKNKTFEVPDTQFIINTANPFNIIKSARQINAMKPDLVILAWWHPYFAPCYQILLNHLKKCRKAFICHNVLPHERFPFDKMLTSGTLRKADFCIVHSSEDMDNLEKLLPKMPCMKNMHPTYNAFKLNNISRSQAREKLGIAEDEKMLLFFGLVRKYKGLMHLLNAMPKVREKTEKTKLFVVGDFGSDKEDYLTIIREKNLDDCVVIRDGYVPDEEVEPYFAAADVNVCPYESATQSGILQIAFGFGLPAICTDVGGLPEVVTDGKTGYVVPPCDSDALADVIIKYFTDNHYEEMRENVCNDSYRFSWDRMTETIEDLWNQVQ